MIYFFNIQLVHCHGFRYYFATSALNLSHLTNETKTESPAELRCTKLYCGNYLNKTIFDGAQSILVHPSSSARTVNLSVKPIKEHKNNELTPSDFRIRTLCSTCIHLIKQNSDAATSENVIQSSKHFLVTL